MIDENEEFDKALALRSQGDWKKSRDTLEALRPLLTTITPGFFLIMGDVYRNLDQLDEAIEAFERAIEMTPVSELPSLCLFHALWDNGLIDDAFEEWKRFVVAGGKSENYDQLLRDLNEST